MNIRPIVLRKEVCELVMALEGVKKRTDHHGYSIGIYLQEQRMVTRKLASGSRLTSLPVLWIVAEYISR